VEGKDCAISLALGHAAKVIEEASILFMQLAAKDLGEVDPVGED
jgi:hypothetical protein